MVALPRVGSAVRAGNRSLVRRIPYFDARGRVHPLAVELERLASALDEVKLLLQVVLLRLVVLIDEPTAP